MLALACIFVPWYATQALFWYPPDRVNPEQRERMVHLCRLIAREQDAKKLAIWIEELNALVQRKVGELQNNDR